MNIIPDGLQFSVGADTFMVRRDVRGMSVWVADKAGSGGWRHIGVLKDERVADQERVMRVIEEWMVRSVLGS